MRFVCVLSVVAACGLFRVESAQACSCQTPGNRVLLASSSGLSPANGPWLIVNDEGSTTRLTDELGVELPLVGLRKLQQFTLCRWSFSLFRPEAPLDPGARYTLSTTLPGEFVPAHERRFKATERAPRRVKRDLVVRLDLSVAPHDVWGCVPVAYEGEPAEGYFDLTVTTNEPTLLFVEMKIKDSKFGDLSFGTASVGEGMASSLAVTYDAKLDVPKLTSSAGCAQVIVHDALDGLVFDEELCPSPGSFAESLKSVEVPEHLVREPPSAEEGCAASNEPAPRSGGALAFAGACAVGLLVRRRRGTLATRASVR